MQTETGKPTSAAPVRIVVVGLNFGRHIVERLGGDDGHPDMRLTGLCDLDRTKAEALSKAHGGLPIYDSLDDVLADPDVDAVGLFTGPEGRARLLQTIIRAGKDAMTTKPFEQSPEAARAVLEEARQLGRVIHLNSPNPGISPDLQAISRWREELDMGAPVSIRSDVWTHYREEADGNWYDDPAKCPAAPVFRLGIYRINDMVRLFGRARRVYVTSTRLFTGRPTSDNAQLSIEFENGAIGNVFASFCVRDGDHYRKTLTVNYERGTVYRDVGPERGDGIALTAVVNDDVWQPRRIAASTTVETVSGDYDWSGFAAAVRGEPEAPSYDVEHVVEPIRIVGSMAESERTGLPVVIDREN